MLSLSDLEQMKTIRPGELAPSPHPPTLKKAISPSKKKAPQISSTLGLVAALIDANQDFDLLLLPNRPHRFGDDPYFTRVRWDYFVRHVLGQEPPPRYRIAPPPPPGAISAGR